VVDAGRVSDEVVSSAVAVLRAADPATAGAEPGPDDEAVAEALEVVAAMVAARVADAIRSSEDVGGAVHDAMLALRRMPSATTLRRRAARRLRVRCALG
jgi:hypothetical protein